MVSATSLLLAFAVGVVLIGQLALIVAIAGSCRVLAARLPAHRAARLDILDAVATT